MKKELFIESIDAIHQQCELDNEISKHLGKAFPQAFEANLLPQNHFLQNALLKVLQTEMNDLENVECGASWIEYFCWELDFGAKNHSLKVYSHGVEVTISNAAELYDFLNNRQRDGYTKKHQI